MQLGQNLSDARRKTGLSQETVAEKLEVSRQTISKWEIGETLPDIQQSKKLSDLYHTTLDELIDFDYNVEEIKDVIDRTDAKVTDKIDWTNTWGKKYPILLEYKNQIEIDQYAKQLGQMLADIEQNYNLSKQDSMLVLKDVLYNVWQENK